MANVIAHEIAHSWTGNLVTNSNFEHFWLNEGFTVFTERKILGRMMGEPERHFAAIGAWKELQYDILEVQGKDNPLTALVPDLTGVDQKMPFQLYLMKRVPLFFGTLKILLADLVSQIAFFDFFV